MKKYRFYIGIDPGVQTGISLWDRNEKKLGIVSSMKIHEAMKVVELWNLDIVKVRVEDARQRKWFGKSSREVLQGAGSIKRDCKIWEDFLTDLGIDFEMVAPKNNKTKLTAEAFKKITGYGQKTNEHARDAASLVFGL